MHYKEILLSLWHINTYILLQIVLSNQKSLVVKIILDNSDKKDNENPITNKYLDVLVLFENLTFNMGKKLLIEVLQGNFNNDRIKKNHLIKTPNFGILHKFVKEEITELLQELMDEGFIEYKELPQRKYIKVLAITKKGREEINNPKGFRAPPEELSFKSTPPNDFEQKLISSLQFYLAKFNLEQQHAIISESNKILCVAGAGSGKTTVLTKRIEYITKFKSVSPEKILAITFTKKAKQEMIDRLDEMGVFGVNVETFNSFSEKIIQNNWRQIYLKMKKMVSYNDKIKIVLKAIKSLKTNFNYIANSYFTVGQRRLKTNEQLLLSFVNDCFHVIDYYKSERIEIDEFYKKMGSYRDKTNAKVLYDVCMKINHLMETDGLRDYADQVKDTVTLFEKDSTFIPLLSHVLVDEFQDVNSIQVKLLKLLNAPNFFAVGDPRQAIFGWRGSKIEHIVDLGKDSDATVIVLTKNYRSYPTIVDLGNKIIKRMRISDQTFGREEDEFENPESKLFNFKSSPLERQFVLRTIKNSNQPLHEIFVLARTNRQLAELSNEMKQKNIAHVLKTDETRAAQIKTGHVTLATIHSIKGLEASMVFVVGCNPLYFPCRVSDHPIIEALNLYDYDKKEEERRLFYVAITRAKKQLYLSYTGKALTSFVDKDCKSLLGDSVFIKPISKVIKYTENTKNSSEVYANLREWRSETSRDLGVPVYMVLSNRSIEELSEKMPINKDELYSIHGLGPSKVARYGDEILRLVNC